MPCKKTKKRCSFVDDKAEHSGEGTDGGDTDNDACTATKSDEEFIDNASGDEAVTDKLPKLSRKEKETISKGDWDVVTGRASRPKTKGLAKQRKTVWKDDDEDDVNSEDEDFVVDDDDDLEAAMEVSKSVQRGLAAGGVASKGTGAPLKPSGLRLDISKEKPFYLRDSTAADSPVVNGANGKVVCGMTGEKTSAYEQTMRYLLSNPYYSGKSCVTVAGISEPNPPKRAKTTVTHERSRVKPLQPNRKLASIFLGQVPAKKNVDPAPSKVETGLFHSKTGEVYYVHPNGRRSPRPGALG